MKTGGGRTLIVTLALLALAAVSCSQARNTSDLIVRETVTGSERLVDALYDAAGVAQTAPVAATDTAPLTYLPPDGTVYIQKSKIERVVDTGAMGRITTSFETEVKVTVRRSDMVYLLIYEPISYTSFKDGQPLANPMLDEMKNVTLTYKISPAGRLIDIDGFDEVEQRILSLFPPDAARLFFQYINRKKLTSAEQVEWQNRVTNYIGRQIEVGSSWVAIENYVFPIMNTAFGYYSAGTIVERTPCGQAECFVIEHTFTTDRRQLAKILGPLAGDLPVPDTGQVDVKSNIDLTIGGHARRVIDPRTLLYNSENAELKIATKLNVPGEGTIYYTETQTIDTEYRYLTSDR